MRPHARRINNAFFNTSDDSLTLYDNSNNFGFSQRCGGAMFRESNSLF